LANPLEAHNSAMKNAPVQSNMHMRKYKVDQACCVASYVWKVCFTRRNMHSYGAYGKFVGNLSTVGSVQRCGHCGSHPDTPRLG
jgi:hypothetical protein